MRCVSNTHTCGCSHIDALVEELAIRAHSQSEDLASGFAMSRFVTLLEEDSNLAIRVRRSGPKTLNDAVQEAILSKRQSCQEAIWLECINHAVHKRNVHVSAPVSLDKGLSPQVADLAKSIQALAEGIAGLKTSQEQNFATVKSSLNEHENHLHQLECANNGPAPRNKAVSSADGLAILLRTVALKRMIPCQAITIMGILVKLWGGGGGGGSGIVMEMVVSL